MSLIANMLCCGALGEDLGLVEIKVEISTCLTLKGFSSEMTSSTLESGPII